MSSTLPQEFLISHHEFKILQKFLPQGYSFAVSNKNTRMQQRKPVYVEENASTHADKLEKPKRKAYAEAEQTIKASTEEFRKPAKILSMLKKNANAGPFLEPVDPVALGIPNYFDIIKNPMDLSTVAFKIKNSEYESPDEFANDVRLIWNNALIFNPPGTQVYRMAENLSSYFEDLFLRDEDALGPSKPQAERSKKKISEDDGNAGRAPKGPLSKTTMEKPLTYQEKKQLSNLIRMLPTEHLWGVWNIVSGGEGNRNNEELEFDIETLPVRTARELEKYVRSKINTLQKKKKPNGPNDAPVDKAPAAYKEDSKGVDNKPTVVPESVYQPVAVGNGNGNIVSAGGGQSNFKVNNAATNRQSSESSFISDLEDSDA